MSLVTSNGVATPPAIRREAVSDPIHALDTGRFEQMFRVANVMAQSGIMPESLTTEGNKNDKTALPPAMIQARAFAIVNQATRWGMDPFAVMSCTSFVHGRLCYEGKLVAAVLETKLGISLEYIWDDKQGDHAGIIVKGKFQDGRERSISGTVADWKTTGNNSPWGSHAKNRKMLAYRGSREWARIWAPGVLLGVYTPDEMDELEDQARDSRRIRQIAPPPPAIEHQPTHITTTSPQPAADKVDLKVNRSVEPELPAEKKKAPPPPATKQQPVDEGRDWNDELNSYDNALCSSGAIEELEEHIAGNAATFENAPEAIKAEARKLEGAMRESLGRE